MIWPVVLMSMISYFVSDSIYSMEHAICNAFKDRRSASRWFSLLYRWQLPTIRLLLSGARVEDFDPA
jgi:hypothetical protein